MLNTYIKTFFEVANIGSFSAASEELFISKVAVMNQINSLEKLVGVPLLNRTNRGVTLTEAGQSFYRNARKIQNLSEAALEEARKIGGKSNHIIRIGTSMMRPCNKLVELWERIQSTHLQFNIVPFNDDLDSLNALLNSLGNKIDCFVTPCGSMKILKNYNFLPFSSYKYEIAMSKRHHLAQKEILQWADIYNESLLLVNRGESYVVDEIRDEIARNHTRIKIIDFNGYYDATTFNMCEQMGYLIGTMDIWKNLHPSLVTIPVAWNYEMPYGIVYAKNPSKTVQDLINVIEKNITDSEHFQYR